MIHLESLFHMYGRAFNCLQGPPGEGDLKASGKQDMPSIYWGAILFTIKVEGYLWFVERENMGEVLECFETPHKWFEANHNCGAKR